MTEDGKFTIDFEGREGGVSVTGLKEGEYKLVETKAPANYKLDETPVYFTVSNGVVTAGTSDGTNGSNVLSFNGSNLQIKDAVKHTYTLDKVDEFHLSMKLKGARFEIYELNGITVDENNKVVYDFGRKIGDTLTTDNNGKIVIDGNDFDQNKVYSIKEVKAPEGYILSDKVYSFYINSSAPAIVSRLVANKESVVNLYNGPQTSIVPNTPNNMNLSVKKQWYKVNGQKEGDMPSESSGIKEIEVQLYQVVKNSEGETISEKPYPNENSTYKLTKGGGTGDGFLGYKWENLPTGSSHNTDEPLTYSYYVKEVTPEGYVATYVNGSTINTEADKVTVDSTTTSKEIEIRNAPEPIHMTVNKVWLDDGQNRPQSIGVKLYYLDKDGNKKYPGHDLTGGMNADQTLNDSNKWTCTWGTLDPGINKPDGPYTYGVEEPNVPEGYAASYVVNNDDAKASIVTVTNTKTQSDKLKVKKVWLKADGSEMQTAPNIPITIQLQKEEGESTGVDVNVTTINKWGDDKHYHYKVSENGSFSAIFQHGGTLVDSDSDLNGGTFEGNKFTISNITSSKNIVLKFNDWVNPPSDIVYDVAEPIWSGNITDVTTKDGIEGITEENARITLNSSNNWTYEWNKLTAPEGTTLRFSVREVNVPAGYDVSYEDNDGIPTGIIYVKNTESEYTRVTASKKWENKDGGTINAPEGATVVFTLYEDGKKTNQNVTLDGTVDQNGETDPWVATFEGLRKTKSDGTEIVYTVSETQSFGTYVAEQASVESGGVIINTPNAKDLSFTKEWENDGQKLTWPDNASIVITLHRKITQDGRDYVDTSFDKEYTIAKADLEKTGRLNPASETFELKVLDKENYTFKFTGLAGKGSVGDVEGDFVYYVTEEQVEGFSEPQYGTNQDAAYDNGTIYNRQEGSYELPHTGGIGTTIFYILGSILVIGGGIYFISRRRAMK